MYSKDAVGINLHTLTKLTNWPPQLSKSVYDMRVALQIETLDMKTDRLYS